MSAFFFISCAAGGFSAAGLASRKDDLNSEMSQEFYDGLTGVWEKSINEACTEKLNSHEKM
jgi:hypothetical protein